METFTVPDCVYEYNEPAEDASHPAHQQSTTTVLTEAQAGEVVFGVGHMHTGALNVTVIVNGRFACASYPVYVLIIVVLLHGLDKERGGGLLV
jgi:hypothetical protein